LDTFVDNVATLAIERVLLRDLPNLVFSNCEPSSLSDEELEAVAVELAEIKEQRATAIHRAAALEAVISTSRQYRCTSQPTPQKGMSSSSDNHDKSDAAETVVDKTTITLSPPSTPEASDLKTSNEQSPTPPSPSSSPSLRNSSLSSDASTPFSSPDSVGSGRIYDNANGSIAYKPVSRPSKGRKNVANSPHLRSSFDRTPATQET
jgi:hypothetical protein